MTNESLKAQLYQTIDGEAGRIIDIGRRIWAHPETGFKEIETGKTVASEFERLGLPWRRVAYSGLRADLSGTPEGAHIAFFGELDSVISREHPASDPVTGAVHACGHNAQVAGMLGVAMAFALSGVLNELGGTISFFGVPAEEVIELEYRKSLLKAGKISFLTGKAQLIAEGELDSVDIAVMFHLESQKGKIKTSHGGSHNGAVAKFVRYTGREAHAGGAPHLGINALNAALIGLAAINAQRETFRDEDHVRVHPIITAGGNQVSTIPADVRIELYVRAKTVEAITDAGLKVDRAFRAGAAALGAECVIESLPAFAPRRSFQPLEEVFEHNAISHFGSDAVDEMEHRNGSTDMGDVSQLMPCLHPYIRAASGAAHGAQWRIEDEQLAYVEPAKVMSGVLVDLLWDHGVLARKISEAYHPLVHSANEYIYMWKNILS